MKRPLILVCLMSLVMVPATVRAGCCYTYVTNGCCEITITKYTGEGGDVVIWDSINGMPVTRIGAGAFEESSCCVDSVTIPDTVRSIGEGAFFWDEMINYVVIGSNVTNIETHAFQGCIGLTSVTIPASVTSVGDGVFLECGRLAAITVDALNPAFCSVDGVMFDKSQTTLVQYPGGKAGSYAIPNSLTNIANEAFSSCSGLLAITADALNPAYSSLDGVLFDKSQTVLVQYPAGKAGKYAIPDGVTNIRGWAFEGSAGLTSVSIPSSVTNIGDLAFGFSYDLRGTYFKGNAPSLGSDVFFDQSYNTVYYLPGTSGWTNPWGGRPTVCWNPEARNLSVQTNQFGFSITGSTDLVIVVEACTNLTNPVWIPVSTNTLIGSVSAFSDPQSSNHPSRFYRFRSP